jgi:hypothetical protein
MDEIFQKKDAFSFSARQLTFPDGLTRTRRGPVNAYGNYEQVQFQALFVVKSFRKLSINGGKSFWMVSQITEGRRFQ